MSGKEGSTRTIIAGRDDYKRYKGLLISVYISVTLDASDYFGKTILSFNNLIVFILLYFKDLNKSSFIKHLSIISFKPRALKKFASFPIGSLEKAEGIELLRALENGLALGTVVFEGSSFSVDVEEDYIKAKEIILKDETRKRY